MSDQILQLPNGVPRQNDYQLLSRSEPFSEMKAFSDGFLKRNARALHGYAKQWVADPLRQWSRQWEYPFVSDRIDHFQADQSIRVLDAGSGATFFPYFLASRDSRITVDCCDYDKSLQDIYQQFNANEQVSVDFSVADLRRLPYQDQSMDVVYCISVLEHTNAYEAIVQEFLRVLRPHGKLIITFDISLDGRHDIPAEKAKKLLALLTDSVDVDASFCPGIDKELETPSLVTTQSFVQSEPDLLPWKKPGPVDHLKSLIKSGRPQTWPALTFYCLDVEKSAA